MRIIAVIMTLLSPTVFGQSPTDVDDDALAPLAGLWEAHKLFGPRLEGPLLIRQAGNRFQADFAGYRLDVTGTDGQFAFHVPGDGSFIGQRDRNGNIRGHWMQPPSRFDGNLFATPALLAKQPGGWRGTVTPQPDTGTFYLLLRPVDETLTAELINPERNLGIFTKLTRLTRNGDALSLHGSWRGRGEERVMLQGHYYPDREVIALRFPRRGGSYDFQRTDSMSAVGFVARPSNDGLSVGPPPARSDGWPTATLSEVGMDPALIEKMIADEILPTPVSSADLSIHSVLIARNGKLVVEEYFHGFNRDLPHDSRSASKSVVSILAAAAMQAGLDLSWETAVYPALGMDELVRREPRRGAITLRHLMNMNTGLDCDDRNPESAANEDVLWDNADELDFYQHTLNVALLHPPGEMAAYCSASANLAGAVIEAAGGHSLLQLIDRLVAAPLNIERYAVPVPPDGHPFMGGGTRWLPRDFLKFPQLLLNEGRWGGKRVISAKNARQLLTPEVKIDDGRDYGLLWWTTDYPFGDRTVRAHFMGGNGGQVAMLVPELGLTVAFNGGNYSDRVGFRIQDELIPKYILAAIRQ